MLFSDHSKFAYSKKGAIARKLIFILSSISFQTMRFLYQKQTRNAISSLFGKMSVLILHPSEPQQQKAVLITVSSIPGKVFLSESTQI
jgi:hypothetical protein